MDEFENVLDAGSELFDQLRRIIRDYGLDVDDAPAVISVAVAGVLRATPVNAKSFEEVIAISKAMWRQTGDDINGLKFDPPHRQGDSVVLNGANN